MMYLSRGEMETTLTLCVMNIEDEMRRIGGELAEQLDRHHQACYSDEEKGFYESQDLERFYDSAEYILAKMRFITDIMKALGLKHSYEIQQNADEEVAKKYVGGNFCWEQMRYYTPEELEQRNQRLLDMVRAWKKEDNENAIA